MRILGVDYVSICVPEDRMTEAKKFYGGVLELPQEGIENDSWVEYRAGNLTIGLDSSPFLPPDGARAPGGEVRLALAVDDVSGAVRYLLTKGVEPVVGPVEFDPCFTAAVRDPFGNLVWLHQRKDGTVG